MAQHEIRRLAGRGTVQQSAQSPGGEGIDRNQSGTSCSRRGNARSTRWPRRGEAKPLMTWTRRGETNHHMLQFPVDDFLFGSVAKVAASVASRDADRPAASCRGVRQRLRVGAPAVRPRRTRSPSLRPEQAPPRRRARDHRVVGGLGPTPAFVVRGLAHRHLAHFSGTQASTQFQLAWVDRKAPDQQPESRAFGQLTLSPDERNSSLPGGRDAEGMTLGDGRRAECVA